MILALALMVLGAMNVTAGEIISLEEVPFCSWDGWTATAKSTGDADCAWVIGEATGQPYGDPSVINYADLSMYSRLLVKVSDGTPRFLFNRDVDEGQWNEVEAESHLIDNTKGGWSAKYFTQEGDVYVVDLKQITKDKGYAHLHAIKGANWANVTVESMEVEKVGKAKQIGWINLINNSNMEGDDASSFFSKVAKSAPFQSEITDGVGVDGSRGIVVEATAKESDAWDNQFWFRFNEALAPEAKYRVSFNYRADKDATVSTQAHWEPSEYIWYDLFGNLEFTSEWKTFEKEGVVTADQSKPEEGKPFLSVAFNLNELADANNYYFDNIVFEVYKAGIVAEYNLDIVKVDFGFDTNIAELVKACGKPRLIFPKDMVSVTQNGEPMEIMSVEGFADGRFYIFMEEPLDDMATIHVKITNPADARYHLIYTNGPGGDIPTFDDDAEGNPDVGQGEDEYAYNFVTPVVINADPEDGSFNLPNSIKEFRVTFDKLTDCAALVAKLGKETLTKTPAEGFAEEIVLSRSGDDLATGEYTITLDKIYPDERLSDDEFGKYSYSFYVGKVEYDPNDQPKVLVKDNFSETEDGFVPEGWTVVFNGSERDHGVNVGSGPRNFIFADGGDFKGALYYRTDNADDEGYVMYGQEPGYYLNLEAGKNYNIHYASVAWKGTPYTVFELLNAQDEVVVSRIDATNPSMGGNKTAITGSNLVEFKFTPEVSGEYRLKWSPAANANGDKGTGMVENLLGNVEVKYMPNQPGIEVTQMLAAAMENAKRVRDENDDERHHGTAFDALDAAIKKYEAESPSYTAPSKYEAATKELNEVSEAMKSHRQLIDTYDPLPVQAQEIIDNNADKKFAKTALYQQLKDVNSKYVVMTTEKQIDPETGEEKDVEVAAPKPLTDDVELQAAIDELKAIVNTTKLLFTEGESKTADTGVKVLVERLRLGVVGLNELGVTDDPVITEANDALTDDDALAGRMKNRIKAIIYDQLKERDNQLFAETIDPLTEETVTPTYNMTVFVKNPNIYKQTADINFTPENVPGWTTPEGYNRPGLSWGWGATQGSDEIAEDCMFQTWGSAYRAEQTIEDLPVGVYTIKMGFGERMNDDENNMVGSFVYAKTSQTPVVGEGEEEQFAATADCPGIGQSFPYDNTTLENVVVADGKLTIGVNGGPSSHTFFSQVTLLMAGSVSGFDYGKAYEEVLAGIKTLDAPAAANVRAIQLFDLNGRRLLKAGKGVTIIKKIMSDGTVQTEKVVVK